MTGLDNKSIRSVLRSGAPRCADSAPASVLKRSVARATCLMVSRSRAAGAREAALDTAHVGIQAAVARDLGGVERRGAGLPGGTGRDPTAFEVPQALRQVRTHHLAPLEQPQPNLERRDPEGDRVGGTIDARRGR